MNPVISAALAKLNFDSLPLPGWHEHQSCLLSARELQGKGVPGRAGKSTAMGVPGPLVMAAGMWGRQGGALKQRAGAKGTASSCTLPPPTWFWGVELGPLRRAGGQALVAG